MANPAWIVSTIFLRILDSTAPIQETEYVTSEAVSRKILIVSSNDIVNLLSRVTAHLQIGARDSHRDGRCTGQNDETVTGHVSFVRGHALSCFKEQFDAESRLTVHFDHEHAVPAFSKFDGELLLFTGADRLVLCLRIVDCHNYTPPVATSIRPAAWNPAQ